MRQQNGNSAGRLAALMLAGLVLAVGAVSSANASLIRVAQESAAGAGDFNANVLGFINPFNTGLTASGFYQYGAPNAASYNGELNGGPNPVSSLSQIFLVNASDGLSLFVVHDNPNDGSGGRTSTQWNLSGDTAAYVVVDDSGESVAVSLGNTQFTSNKRWVACCTDGYAIGGLDGSWTMLGQFLAMPTGISSWSVISSDFSVTNLTLGVGRRVQLTAVPEPVTLALLGLGLAGLGFAGRRRR